MRADAKTGRNGQAGEVFMQVDGVVGGRVVKYVHRMTTSDNLNASESVTIGRRTRLFVDEMRLEAQQDALDETWATAPESQLRAFATRSRLEAEHARHDWQVFCGLVSGLSVAVGLLFVGIDLSATWTVAAVFTILVLAGAVLGVRLSAIRVTQQREIKGAVWMSARGID
jgi:hypothetical protein